MAKHVPLDAAFDLAVKDEPTAEWQEMIEIIAGASACLPQCEKVAVEAYTRVSGDSCRKVARQWGVSTQTVCNWAQSGIARLRRRLEGLRDCDD